MLEVFSLILGTKCPFQGTEFDLDQSLICKKKRREFLVFGLFMEYIIYILYVWIVKTESFV